MMGPSLRRRALLLAVLLVLALGGTAVSPSAADDEARGGSITCFGKAGTIWATATADVDEATKGTKGPDVIIGSAGNDIIFGRGGDDLICGNGGHDMIFGGSGRDRLQGGRGGDILYGENGGDTLLGGPGGNILNGGPRTDRCLSGDTYVSCELPSVDKILAQCPTKREIARIDAEFDLTFDADPTQGSYACGPAGGSAYLTPLQKRAYNTVRIMGRISFDAALPWDSGHTLGDWFALAITGIRFRDDIDNSFCCDPAGVINLKVDVGALETDLWIRYPYDAGLAHLMLLMVHEARHNNGYPHTCTWVDGIGFTDDDNIGQLGAWGVQYYLETLLADHTSPAFLAGPAGHRSFYQDTHRAEAQGMINHAYFCDY